MCSKIRFFFSVRRCPSTIVEWDTNDTISLFFSFRFWFLVFGFCCYFSFTFFVCSFTNRRLVSSFIVVNELNEGTAINEPTKQIIQHKHTYTHVAASVCYRNNLCEQISPKHELVAVFGDGTKSLRDRRNAVLVDGQECVSRKQHKEININ